MKISESVFAAITDINQDSPFTLRVRGQCMVPVICCGAEVVVTRKKNYLPGDIIVFRSRDGTLLAHRLLAIYRKDGIWKALAKPDRSERSDAAVAVRDILGHIRVSGGIPVIHRLESLRVGLFILLKSGWRKMRPRQLPLINN
ncbi:MAG: S24/S26 family peptidase [Arenicellales bacterium]